MKPVALASAFKGDAHVPISVLQDHYAVASKWSCDTEQRPQKRFGEVLSHGRKNNRLVE